MSRGRPPLGGDCRNANPWWRTGPDRRPRVGSAAIATAPKPASNCHGEDGRTLHEAPHMDDIDKNDPIHESSQVLGLLVFSSLCFTVYQDISSFQGEGTVVNLPMLHPIVS